MSSLRKISSSFTSLRTQSTSPSKEMTRPIGNHRVTAPPPSSSCPISNSPRHRSPSTKTRDTPQGKNLRWTAIALVDKLSRDRELLSSVVADEIALAASDDLLLAHPNRDAAAVERNTRRRVYDALKVMVAAGCVQKEGKALRWIGVDDLRQGSCNVPHPRQTTIRVSICKVRRSIANKKGILSDIQKRITAFQRFLSRRQENAFAPVPTENKLQFPFVLVKAKTPIVTYSPGKKRVRVNTPSKFKLYSESDLICMMVERRKSRIATKKRSRVSRNARRQLVRKRSSEASSPPTPPPPPPPSPTEFKLDSVQIVPAKQLRRGEQFKLVDLALNTISKPVKHGNCIETSSSADQIEQACELDILDNVRTENYLDSEMLLRYPKDEDEEVLFLEDIGEKERVPGRIYINSMHPTQQSSKTSSTASDEPDSQFERLLRKEPSKEEFVQDVSVICDDDLAISSHAEDIDSGEVFMQVISDKGDPPKIGFDVNTDDADPPNQSKKLTQKDS